MNKPSFQLLQNGDAAITLIFDDPISEKLSRQIYWLKEFIQLNFKPEVEDIIPAYQSLTICYAPLRVKPEELITQLKSVLQNELPQVLTPSSIIEIPVCYQQPFASDLEQVAKYCKLTTVEVIQRHSSGEYLVHMLGFSPGFLYLGGLSTQLFCPRKATPEKKVAAGSVGIGGQQTGIYPQSTPGGWNIIGRTPKRLFIAEAESPFIAAPLDKIKFVPISNVEFQRMQDSKL